jgi:multiple sugar transport system ATP-binding protein
VAGFIGTPPMNFIPGTIRHQADGVFFDTRRYRLLLPASKARALIERRFHDKRIVLGVRAEKAVCRTRPEPDWPYENSQFEAKVELVEFMGSDTYLHLDNADHSLVARVDPLQLSAGEGDAVTVGFDMNAVHFFDPATEERLC